jgi:hypothetical protein
MKKVDRSELLGLGEYEQIRQRFLSRIIADKKDRRVIASDEVSLVFENRDTVLFQIQEMLRTERITKESAILHELETYNDLVPAANELSATMFVEIADAVVRERRLTELAGLEDRIALEVAGVTIRARNETRGVLPDRTTAVHYVKFALGAELAKTFVARVASGTKGVAIFILDHPRLSLRQPLSPATLHALRDDLAAG